MTEVLQNSKNTQSQLPSITNKQEQHNLNSQLDKSQDSKNVLPLTHAQKRKKHRKKLRKHSPQYYEHKRLQKFNKKLEQKWDSHFINDQIPDLYAKKKKPKPQGKTLSKLANDKRSMTPLNYKNTGNTVGSIASKKQTVPLPKIQKIGSKRSNSFNVHAVHEKGAQQPEKVQKTIAQSKAQQKPLPDLFEKRKRTSQISRRPKEQQNQKNYLQEYRKTLNELFEQKKFLNCHKQVLECFFQGLERKNVRDILDREFELLRNKQSLIFKVMDAIKNRQTFLDKLKASGSKLSSADKQILELIDHYRTSTLAVVQQILKWKESWHGMYSQKFKKHRNIDLIYKTQNYLLTLITSTDSILEKIQKEKSAQSLPKVNQTHHIQNKVVQKQTKPQQKEIKDQTKQNNLPTGTEQIKKHQQKPTLNQAKVEQAQGLDPLDKIQSSKKIQQTIAKQAQPKKVIAENSQPINDPTRKDPFLISLHSIAKQDKNIILKIRACQLLLIEQNFNFIKK